MIDMKPGPKPQGHKTTIIRLSPEAMERIDEIVGPGRRAEFVRDAVDQLLAAAEALKRYRGNEQ